MYVFFLTKTAFFYDLNNKKKILKKQTKKIFFIQNFVSNLQLEKREKNIFFTTNQITTYESSY